MKNFLIIFIVFILVMALAGCDTEAIPEDEPNIEPEISEPEIDENAPVVEGNFYDEFGYTVTMNGETVRYYPTFMQNNSEVIYDENCNPTVIAGGALTEDEVNSREDIFFDIPTETDWAMVMQPNTKAVYDLHGFIQNIYYEVPVGSGNYQLAPPEFDGVDDVIAEFTLGLEGSPVTLAVGGQIGDWTLSELEINADTETGEVNSAYGTFTGSVVLDGKIVWNRMVEGAYDLIINDDEISKIPHYVDPEGGRARTRFMLNIPEDIANNIKLDADEEMYCRVYLSDYDFVFARTEGMEKMTVTQIDVMSNTAEFTLGLNGKKQSLAVKDKIGDWTLEELEVQMNGAMGVTHKAKGTFAGNVVFEGKICLNEIITDMYFFKIDEDEEEKIPHYISSEGQDERKMFALINIENFDNIPELKLGEEVSARITVSEYNFIFARMMAYDTMVITAIEILE